MPKVVKVKSLPSSNEHLPEPYKIGEKVIYLGDLDKSVKPESFRQQFIRIKRIKTKSEMTESRKHFEL